MKHEKGTQKGKYKNREIVKGKNQEIDVDNATFENPKTSINLKTNLHIKHLILIVFNMHVYLYIN